MNYVKLFGCLLTGWLAATIAWAQPTSINEVTKLDTYSGQALQLRLPFFETQKNAGLKKSLWLITLPEALANKPLPSLLIPQPVQGAIYSINGQVIYNLPVSDEHTLRNWYQPVLIAIPKALLKAQGPTQIKVEQTGHLRSWFIAPMFVGDLQELRPHFSNYVYVSQTLYSTINVLSAMIGVFFLVIGLRARSLPFIYTGAATLTWSCVISLALVDSLPTDAYFFWRMTLYAVTGLLIYFITMFSISHFRYPISKKVKLAMLGYLNLGWIVYAVLGPAAEAGLDILWTGSSLSIYVISIGWLMFRDFSRGQLTRAMPIAAYWSVTSLLGAHDYVVQSGILPFDLPTTALPLWADLALQPIYLTHLALPIFIIMAMWLLARDHLYKTRRELLHVTEMLSQRERIVNDIHDGVGSRINLLLWSLRTHEPNGTAIQHELQRCMEELRFAINPTTAGAETLHHALESLCTRLTLAAHDEGIELTYGRMGVALPVASDTGLHLYKAAQECLSNALRHSQATRIALTLKHLDAEIQVIVEDDGVGIAGWDASHQSQVGGSASSLGLRSLASRMQSKGGQCHIQSDTEGTTVRLTMPHVA